MTDLTLADRYGAGVERAGVGARGPSTPDELAAYMVECTEIYCPPEARGSIRGGMGDAAHLCDAIAREIAKAGRKSKRRDEMAAVAKRCGDAIWAMRERIGMSPLPTPPHGGTDDQ